MAYPGDWSEVEGDRDPLDELDERLNGIELFLPGIREYLRPGWWGPQFDDLDTGPY